MILNVTLNHEGKGEFFLYRDDGDFLIKVEDLGIMGFRGPKGDITEISGEPYISLRSVEGVGVSFNEEEGSLEITASPDLLPRVSIDFTPRRPSRVYYPRDNSAFLNYRLDYSGGSPSVPYSFDLTNEVGVRFMDLLLLSDSTYKRSEDEERFVRLMSRMIYDRRSDMQRLVIGDSFASSGELGSSINLGGLSFSKVYRIDPYFMKYPAQGLSGVASMPSDVEVYLNGMLVGRERLLPGGFDLRNIPYYGGAGIVEIVIRDPFGREQRIRHPFYFTDLLLRRGLHEYSYNIGYLREDFGTESNRYGDPAFSAFHRYGVSDSLTFGLRGEATEGLYNVGPQASYNLYNAGILNLSLSNSFGDQGSGSAWSLNYSYLGRKINARLLLRGYSEDYTAIATIPSPERLRYEAGVGAGFSDRYLGSISLDYTATEYYRDSGRRVTTATYSRNLRGDITAFITLRNTDSDKETSNEFFVGMSYHLKENTISVQYQGTEDSNTETLQVQKNPPVGEGLGYRASLQRSENPAYTTYTVNPSLQYNSRYNIVEGEYRGDYREEGNVGETYRFSISGGIAYVGDTMGLSRPFNDSFGLVKVGDVEGVRVYHNNQEIGRTDSSGKVLVPTLASYYDNLVTINDRDIPIDYHVPDALRYISPPLRSGSCIVFDATRIKAIVGTIGVKEDGAFKPLEFHDVTMRVGDREAVFQTGKGGEFYLENVMPGDEPDHKGCAHLREEPMDVIKPGRYEASFDYMGRAHYVEMVIPHSGGMMVDVGKVECEVTTAVAEMPEAEPPVQVAPVPAIVFPEVEPIVAPPLELPVEMVEVEKPLPGPFVVHFPLDSHIPFREDEDIIASVASYLALNPAVKAEIEGHADQLGSDSYNIKLGMRRAHAVERRLVALGIGRERINVSSFGERRPVCKSLDKGCRRENRRAVIRMAR